MVKTEHKQLIYAALKLNDSSYHQLVFDTGMQWIRDRFSLNDEEITYVVAKSAEFWAWWRNQWGLRDAQFVYDCSLERQELPLSGDTLQMAMNLYYELHQAQNIKVYPNRFVIADVGRYLKEFANQETLKLKTIVYAGRK